MDVAVNLEVEQRSRRSAREGWLLVGADLFVFVTTFFVSRITNWIAYDYPFGYAMWNWRGETGDQRVLIYGGLTAIALTIFWKLGHYARRRPFWQELGDVVAVGLALLLIDAALIFLTKSNLSRLWMVTNWGLIILCVPLLRVILKHSMMRAGAWRRPTVIFGTGPNALDSASAYASEPLLGFDVIAFLRAPGSDAGSPDHLDVDGRKLSVIDPGPYPSLLPDHLGRPHVVIALEMDEMARCGWLIERLSLSYRNVDIISPLRGVPLTGTQVTHFFSHDVLALRLNNNLARPWPQMLKRGFDIVAASSLLLIGAPAFAFIAWQVRRTGRKVIYGHRRVGRSGRSFTCYKFRTMVTNADAVLERLLSTDAGARAEWERDHKLKNDPRITPIGAWLRRTSLDELPQLWNVLKGDMSLVGPRPVIDNELARYGENLIYYLESKPGLTGLWQISGRNDVDYRRRVHLDCWYVKNWTLWYDLVILLKTFRVVLNRNGAY